MGKAEAGAEGGNEMDVMEELRERKRKAKEQVEKGKKSKKRREEEANTKKDNKEKMDVHVKVNTNKYKHFFPLTNPLHLSRVHLTKIK